MSDLEVSVNIVSIKLKKIYLKLYRSVFVHLPLAMYKLT